MRLFTSVEFDSLEDLFEQQLGDLYDTERRLIDAIPEMIDAASSHSLKQALETHLQETQMQARRLEDIFNQLGKRPDRETCEAMKGLVSEARDMVSAKGDPDIKDAALIAAAQRVEHYEIAGYGTACSFAQRLGQHEIARMLHETLEQEKHADQILTEIAEQSVNVRAQHV